MKATTAHIRQTGVPISMAKKPTYEGKQYQGVGASASQEKVDTHNAKNKIAATGSTNATASGTIQLKRK
jgi:hypothetical protein